MNDTDTDPMIDAVEMICNHLSERTACLFLGAGINFGIPNDDGDVFPLAKDLSMWICRDLLDNPSLTIALSDASEMARHKYGDKALCDYIYKKFSTFKTGTAHLALVQLPWDAIYTTNYDLLLEEAAKKDNIVPAGALKPIFSSQTDVSSLSESDIPYFKLHGSIDYAKTEEGRLIISREDYRYYRAHRTSLFRRLKRDLLSRTLVFIGYGFADDNLRALADDCRETLSVDSLPLSYAIRPDFSPDEETFWKEKYNIQLLRMDGASFSVMLRNTWQLQNREVLPLAEWQGKIYLLPDEKNRFQKVGESFYEVKESDCTGASNPAAFFKGAEPTWGDIREKVAPPRDAYWHLMEAIFPEISDPAKKASCYLVTGPAGTGKTTLLKSALFDLARSYGLPVLVHIPGTPLDIRFVRPLSSSANPQRIVILIHHAAEIAGDIQRFLNELRASKVTVTLLLEERRNQWNTAMRNRDSRFVSGEFDLGSLSDSEIDAILESLRKHKALNKLEGAPLEEQRSHFQSLAQKELLVALRELTSDQRFDLIIQDEFSRIPSQLAKRAYIFVAALGRIDLSLRYETLIHILDVTTEQFAVEVIQPSAGVLIGCEATGRSRHDAGYRLTARHPVIASVVFEAAVPTDDAKFEIISALLTNLDPGFREDKAILNGLFMKKEFVHSLASPEKRRAVFSRVERLLPSNPFVLQHRSILERDLQDADAAVSFARSACKISPRNPVLLNTLGLALEFKAKKCTDPFEKARHLQEADKLFDDALSRDRSDAFAYLGKCNVLRQYAWMEQTHAAKVIKSAEVLSLLEMGYEATGSSPIIGAELAQAKGELGDTDEAMAILKAGLKKSPNESRLRDLLIRLLSEQGNTSEALAVAQEGEQIDPTSWRLQRHIARLKRRLGEPIAAVRGAYEAAIRGNKGELSLYIELGAYLFISGQNGEASKVFTQAGEVPVSSIHRNSVTERWVDETGNRIVFSGVVRKVSGGGGLILATPQNFEAFFWRTGRSFNLREGQAVKFHVGFNSKGAIALIV